MNEPQIVVERRIKARPETVFTFFTETDRWLSWMGRSGQFDPRPGGDYRFHVVGDAVASGRYLEVDPHRRVVFTFGWEGDGEPMPPGSSVVEVTLEPDGEGTLLRLVHRDLPEEVRAQHEMGWNYYADRLTARAEGRDPGLDTWME